MFDDLLASLGQGQGTFDASQVDALVKAMSAGQTSGTVLDGTQTSGSALKFESLEATLKNLTFQKKHFTFYNQMPKLEAKSTNEEYNQLVNYGASGKYNVLEGVLPETVDSSYRRMSEFVKYKGVTGEVTDVLTQTATQINPYTQEIQNKMTLLLQSVEKELFFGNSNVDPQEFDGLNRLHFKLLDGITTNEDYFNSPFNVDMRGNVLTEEAVDEASSSVVNQGYGFVTGMYAPPSVFSGFVKQKYDIRRIIGDADVKSGTFGQKVTGFMSQYGQVAAHTTIFGRKSVERLTTGDTALTQAVKGPAAITPDATTPLAAVTDTTNKFGTAFAGDYFVAVAAVNSYGEGPLTALSASEVAVASTESIDMKWTITDNAYPATGFVVYRGEKDQTTAIGVTKLYPVMHISVAELAAGYDGAAAGLARDRNYDIPNTESAWLYETGNSNILSIKELGKMKKLDLAIISPVRRFAILYYLTQIMYAPKKVARITNIGSNVPS